MTSTTPSRRDDEQQPSTTRRQLLTTAGLLGIGSLSGCLGSSPVGNSSSSDLPDSVSVDSFTRIARRSEYQLRYQWVPNRSERPVGFDVAKDRYVEAKEASRSVADTFDDAVEGEFSKQVAATLAEALDTASIESPADRIDAVAEFVRSVEYVTDKAGTGKTEYPKYVVETLVENEGDCEDFANVLGGVYSAPSFDLDPMLVIFPGHVGIGLDPEAVGPEVEEVTTAGEREFVYVDSTHSVDVGVVPEELRSREVIATYRDGWTLHNAEALAGHLREAVLEEGYTDPLQYL